jgi:hypothetical protein
MLALGEDPNEWRDLLASLVDTWQPANGYELALVKRLARTLWRMEGSDRIQESVGMRRVEKVSEMQTALRGGMQAQVAQRLPALQALAAAVARPDFVTGEAELELFYQVFGTNLEYPGAKEISHLLERLEEGASEELTETAAAREAGAGPPAEPAPREQTRQQLLQALARHVRMFENTLACSPEVLRSPDSPYERDVLMAQADETALLMLRVETSGLRQARWITRLLKESKKLGAAKDAES